MRQTACLLLIFAVTRTFALSIDTGQIEPRQESTTVFVDTKESPRTTAVRSQHPIRFDSSWDDGSTVRVSVNGEVLTNTTSAAAGKLLWSPEAAGTYDFEHFDGNTTLTASFIVKAGVGVESVTARQRYPWNGMVDLTFTLTGEADKKYVCSFVAKDLVGGTNLTMKTLQDEKGAALASNAVKPGTYRWAWNAAADLPDGFKCDRVTVTATAEEHKGLYMVVDLSGGTTATSYPVSYLDAVPSGGWTDEYKKTKLVLRMIPAGTYTMGDVDKSNNQPHSVTISRGFYTGIFEVTQKQYLSIIGSNPSEYVGDMRPVEGVMWKDIRGSTKGIQWPTNEDVDETSLVGILRKKTGLKFDLPTEVEWEYACRAGTSSKFNNGGSALSDLLKVARCSDNAGGGAGGYTQHTTVGTYTANNWGLYDMHGNVWEWCLDWYDSDPPTGTDPKGPSSSTSRVRRGGSFFNSTTSSTSAERGHSQQDYAYCGYGFRMVVR